MLLAAAWIPVGAGNAIRSWAVHLGMEAAPCGTCRLSPVDRIGPAHVLYLTCLVGLPHGDWLAASKEADFCTGFRQGPGLATACWCTTRE